MSTRAVILYENEVGKYNELTATEPVPYEYELDGFVSVRLPDRVRLIPIDRIFYMDIFEDED